MVKTIFWKFLFAISFDSGLRFWCSSARFEATDKAYITIAVDPPSTTAKIRGQARHFYNKGWRTAMKGITSPIFTPCHSFVSHTISLRLPCPSEASSWWLLGLCTFAPCSFRAKVVCASWYILCWHQKEVGVQNRKDSKESRSKKCQSKKSKKEKKETPLAISCRKRVSSMNI